MGVGHLPDHQRNNDDLVRNRPHCPAFPAEKFYNPFVFMLLFGIPPIVIGSYEASQNA